jgi:hypothetical protein
MRKAALLAALCLLASCSPPLDTPWTLADADRLSGKDAADCVADCGVNYSTFYARPTPDSPVPTAEVYEAAFSSEPVFGLRGEGRALVRRRSETFFFRAPLAEGGQAGWFVWHLTDIGSADQEERRTSEAECPGLGKAADNLSTLLKVRERGMRYEPRNRPCGDCYRGLTFWVREGQIVRSETWRNEQWPDPPPAIEKMSALLSSCWTPPTDPNVWPTCPAGALPGPKLHCSPQGSPQG